MTDHSIQPDTTMPRPPYTNATSGYKTYIALLTQVGTAAPTAIILQNTIGAIVWTRATDGSYQGTLAGAFPAAKTWTTCNINQTTDSYFGTLYGAFIKRVNDNIVHIQVGEQGVGGFNGTDGELLNTPIEIRVYN